MALVDNGSNTMFIDSVQVIIIIDLFNVDITILQAISSKNTSFHLKEKMLKYSFP